MVSRGTQTAERTSRPKSKVASPVSHPPRCPADLPLLSTRHRTATGVKSKHVPNTPPCPCQVRVEGLWRFVDMPLELPIILVASPTRQYLHRPTTVTRASSREGGGKSAKQNNTCHWSHLLVVHDLGHAPPYRAVYFLSTDGRQFSSAGREVPRGKPSDRGLGKAAEIEEASGPG